MRLSEDELSPDVQSDLFASLRLRLDAIGTECEGRWRKAECKSSISLVLEGWVRRMALDWPRAAVGTADGLVVLADLESGKELTRRRAHPRYVEGDESVRDMRLLHGDYDGGGLTAIAIDGDYIASAGRDGGAHLWLVGNEPEKLQDRGELRDSGDAVVSSIVLSAEAMDENGADVVRCWTGSLDGVVRCWEAATAASPAAGPTSSSSTDGASSVGGGESTSASESTSANELAALPAPRCTLRLKASAAVLDLAVLDERKLLACATADGGVELFSTVDGAARGVWRPLAPDMLVGAKGAATRSVALATFVDESGAERSAVVAGGADGSMHMRHLVEASADGADAADIDVPVSARATVQFDETREPLTLTPPHQGQVVALAPVGAVATGRESGLLVSGAHDGTLRVWDLAQAAGGDSQACIFGLGGYKVWLGSVCTDGRRLVSDGRDNVLVVHDFSDEAAAQVGDDVDNDE